MDFPKIKLKAARVNAELTQTEVARLICRNKQTIINWESGYTAISAGDLQLLSELYKIPIEYLEIPGRARK